jgi:hypothetical protein
LDRFKKDSEVIKRNLLKNEFPEGLLNAVINNFVNESTRNDRQSDVDKVATVPKKEIFLVLPYFGSASESCGEIVKKLIQRAYNQVRVRVVFRTTFRIGDLFSFKDFIPKRLLSNVVYRVHCTDCTEFYVGKTKRHLGKRFDEHRDRKKPTAVTKHLIECNHNCHFENVEVLSRARCDLELLIKESLTIKQLKPGLNKDVTSYPLEMF